MRWQDVLLIVESVAIIKICFDDHAMKRMAEESLKVCKESLEAQKQYLELRKRWYLSRTTKKVDQNEKGELRPSDNSNVM